MTFSNERFLQNFLENEVKTDMLVVDGHAGNGQKTRFLASRVGKNGMVLSFHDDREAANKTAASLFMAGLQERATIENGGLSEEGLQKELGRLTKADLMILDYSSSETVNHHQINADCDVAWEFLKESGQLLVLISANDDFSTVRKVILTDLADCASSALFAADDGSTLIFEKKATEE